MKLMLAAAAALSLGACAGLPGGDGSASGVLSVLREVAMDPNCAHTDRVSGNLGGLTGNNLNVFLERTCPARPDPPAGAPTPPPL